MARILAFAPDLFFASKIRETLTAAGHDVTLASAITDATPDTRADLVIVDLDAYKDSLPRFDGRTPVLGFYSHVEVETRTRAEAAGFDLVVPRSRMAREMPDLVAQLLESPE